MRICSVVCRINHSKEELPVIVRDDALERAAVHVAVRLRHQALHARLRDRPVVALAARNQHGHLSFQSSLVNEHVAGLQSFPVRIKNKNIIIIIYYLSVYFLPSELELALRQMAHARLVDDELWQGRVNKLVEEGP